MKLSTITLIERSGYDAPTVHSFTLNPEGEREAERLFRALAAEQEECFTDEEVDEGWKLGGLSEERGSSDGWTLDVIRSQI